MVVGDDAQAIYAFRSATVANILEFPTRFPGTTIVKLERNYRSTRPILEATNAVIALSPQRHEKTLWTERVGGPVPSLLTCIDERDQADAVCRSILEHRERGTSLHEQAVLFRAGHHSDVLEVELTRRNIPFVKYGGLKFLESAHVKDALAVLRIADNPRDEVSWFRVLQLLDHVGPAGARRVMAAIGVSAPGDPMTRFLEQAIAVPAPARAELEGLREAFGDLAVEGTPPAAQVERVRRFLEPLLRRRYDQPEPRLRDLEQLEQLATGFESRARFVTDLTLDPPVSTSDLAGTAPPGRGLRDPVDDPFGQGRRVGRRARDPRGGRHDPLGHVDRRSRPARGGAPAAVRRAHAGARRAPRPVPAPLPPLEPRVRGPALVRAADAVPARGGPEPVLARDDLRGRDRRAFGRGAPDAGANGVDALLAGLWSD